MKASKRVGAVAFACLAVLASTSLPVAATKTGSILPKKTVPLSAAELRKLYSGKTWQWSAGGGRFIAKDQRFIAWSTEDGPTTIGEGRWEVHDDGRLCLDAVWVAKEGSQPAFSCFRHVRDRGTIYQRREPAGRWYIFKTFKPKPDDEIHKLLREDTITAKFRELKQSL